MRTVTINEVPGRGPNIVTGLKVFLLSSKPVVGDYFTVYHKRFLPNLDLSLQDSKKF